MWTIFKDFIEFVAILLLFYILVFWPQGTWDLSFLTRDRISSPCIGRQSLNHWTTSKVPYETPKGRILMCEVKLCSVTGQS